MRLQICRIYASRPLLDLTDAAHGLMVSLPNRDKLTMRAKPLITLGLILTLSKDEASNRIAGPTLIHAIPFLAAFLI